MEENVSGCFFSEHSVVSATQQNKTSLVQSLLTTLGHE